MSRRVETARGTVHRWQCDHMGHVNVRAYGVRSLDHLRHRLDDPSLVVHRLHGDERHAVGGEHTIEVGKIDDAARFDREPMNSRAPLLLER